MKRGYAILLDAVVALTVVMVILTALMGLRYSGSSASDISVKRLHYVSEDTMDVLNKIGVLDQIGEEWAAANGNQTSPHWLNASNLSAHHINQLLPTNVGWALTIDGEMVANNTRIPPGQATTLTHSTRLLVGYGRGLPTRGNVARAFLANIREKETSSYTYFGGYTGQGNITVFVRGLPSDATIQRCCFELNSPSDFNLYINENFAGAFEPIGGNMSANLREGLPAGPGNGCVAEADLSNIILGAPNNFTLMFTEGTIEDHYIGGGFIHILYNTSEMDTDEVARTTWYHFPGINGIINLYDSFYVPGRVESIGLYLHYMSNYSTYLNIGGTTVFSADGNESEQFITLSDAEIQGAPIGLIYHPDLDQNNVPLRMGTGNMSEVVASGNADVVLITDVSGSMDFRIGDNTGSEGEERGCDSPDLFDDDTKRISLAKCLARDFINTVMNHTGNRMALVSFDTEAEADGGSSYRFSDPQDNESMVSHVMGYSNDPSGGTCVCCAINQAYNLLDDVWSPTRSNYIIVMTDGITGYNCGSCNYQNRTVLFTTDFEADSEIAEWTVDGERTTAPGGYLYGKASAGSYGPHSGSSYFGIWGGFNPEYVALNRTPIDISAHNDVKVRVWYSYEDTEDSDEMGLYYWDGSGWEPIVEVLSPDIGSGQLTWAVAEADIPDSLNDLVLQFWGSTSTDSEHIMIDDLEVLVPPETSGCGDCTGSCTQTTGDRSCGATTGDCENTYCLPAVYDAICASQRAQNDLGAEVRTIGFGPATLGCLNSELTLIHSAECGDGAFCPGGNSTAAVDCYLNFSKDIYESSLESQTVFYGGELRESQLFPDSYLEIDYMPLNLSDYGTVSITQSTDRFDDTLNCRGVVEIPPDVVVSSARVTSYSGEHWTDYLDVDSGGGEIVYQLSDWGSDYALLGDPYIVQIPPEKILIGGNTTLTIETGDSEDNRTGCSPDDRAIYTIRLQSMVGYGGVFDDNLGCNWEIEFEDGTSFNAPIPTAYGGSSNCFYTPGLNSPMNKSYVAGDAVNDAVFRLMDQLDLDDDGEVDLLFDPNMIEFEISSAGGVQSLWGPAKFKLMVWL
ncbi:MAG: VWA domain-containing protein [Candidatus Altiarchaeales archaeon]|nr:VWA domain-containing protein [Candidatus Altiarchaeales archaeon]MBD3416830.1 VWA domain-containing protein [Candidatus Altiarchaeales archaeon]